MKKLSRLDSGFFSATNCIARSSPPWIIVLLEKLNQGSSRIISSPDHEFAIGLDPELNLAQKFELNCEKTTTKCTKTKFTS